MIVPCEFVVSSAIFQPAMFDDGGVFSLYILVYILAPFWLVEPHYVPIVSH